MSSASNEVSSNNRLTIILRLFIHHTGRGRSLLLRLGTLDAVMTRKPLFFGQTNNIVIFCNILKFLWYKCRIWHLNDDSKVLSEYLKIDLIWALLRMQLGCLMQNRIPRATCGKLWLRRISNYLKPCSSTNLQKWILSHDRRFLYRFYHVRWVYSLEECPNGS